MNDVETVMEQLNVLHVEDDSDDAFFFGRALRKVWPGCEVYRVANGEQALKYLNSCDGSGFPDLMILDLKLPGMSGFEVLGWMRSQDRLKGLPVVVLSGSSLEIDRKQASELGASAYLVKSSVYTDTAEAALR